MRRTLAWAGMVLGCAALLAAFALAGCGKLTGKLTGALKANTPPHTVLFVNGAVDTVNHVAHLFWFGTDPDGSVQGFEWQLLNPRDTTDESWHFTTKSDSIFTVFADSGYTNPLFSVRAIDNTGARDPNPPRQTFSFSNQAPKVKLVQKPLPNDITFASVSVTWTASDPDGDASKLRFLVWLDGKRATPEETATTAFTMLSERFLVNGDITTGPRKLFVQAIDDGGRASAIDSVTWIVRGPRHTRLLIVDDFPKSVGAQQDARLDTLYSNPAGRLGLSPSDTVVLHLERTQPFKTAKDVEQTFKQFDSVIWYRGTNASVSSVLPLVEPGIGEYLKAGGNFFAEGMYMFHEPGTLGNMTEDFVTNYLHARLARQFSVSVLDSVVGFGNNNPSNFVARMNVGGQVIGRDPIPFAGIFAVAVNPVIPDGGGLRQFLTTDSTEVAMWAQPGTLTPANDDRVPVGLTVPQAGGGRAVVLGMGLPVTPGNNAGVSAFITNLFRQFGLDQPLRP